MKTIFSFPIYRFILALIIFALPSINQARQGSMAFLTTHTSVKAGEAGASIRPGWDWVGRQYDTQAKPDVPTQFDVETWSNLTELHFKFTIPDSTQNQLRDTAANTSPFDPEELSDQILIHLDPNDSHESQLHSGDHKYQILINRQATNNTNGNCTISPPSTYGKCIMKHFTPDTINGTWNFGTTPTSATATVRFNGNAYEVAITIFVSEIGTISPSGNFGLAIAVINNLGAKHNGKTQLSGSAFPLSIPISNGNNPVILDETEVNGVWAQPDKWGVGYTTTNVPAAAGDLKLDHKGKDAWYSASIRLSKCTVLHWEGVAEGGANQSGDPTGWYKYYPKAPTCEMGVWVNVTNKTNPGVIKEGRLLILWADSGIAPDTWKVVKLTDPIAFSPGESQSVRLWTNVPAGGSYHNGTTHPCMRVYILPKDLNPSFNENDINAITNSTGVGKLEGAYGIGANLADTYSRVAQMNFTNLAAQGTSCPDSNMCKFTSLSLPQFALLDNNAYLPDVLAKVSDSRGEGVAVLPKHEVPSRGKEEPLVRVSITGFGIEQTTQQQKYVFIEPLGGLAWAEPQSVFLAGLLQPVAFGITNPAVLFRDFSTPTPTDIPSPTRKIVLATQVKADSGIPVTIKVLPFKDTLAPGETVIAKTVLAVAPALPTAPVGIPLWQWLLLILIILLLLLIMFWRKPQLP